jgi:hypothetical protein
VTTRKRSDSGESCLAHRSQARLLCTPICSGDVDSAATILVLRSGDLLLSPLLTVRVAHRHPGRPQCQVDGGGRVAEIVRDPGKGQAASVESGRIFDLAGRHGGTAEPDTMGLETACDSMTAHAELSTKLAEGSPSLVADDSLINLGAGKAPDSSGGSTERGPGPRVGQIDLTVGD